MPEQHAILEERPTSELRTISLEEAVERAKHSADSLLKALERNNAAYSEEIRRGRVLFDIRDRLMTSFLRDIFQYCEVTGTEAAEDASYTPLRAGERTETRNSFGMEFVLIPAGEFQMGSESGEENEGPVHTVRIREPFFISKYSVTQAQWEAVMGNNPSFFTGDSNRPVETVSWFNVQEFIGKLSALDANNDYRLPTEAEWEYAARAGSTSAYSFGDDATQLADYAWYDANAGETTHPVGQLKPNAWGLYDMHGNVWEWVQDWYADDYYHRSPEKDPQGPEIGESRVLRGGGFFASQRRVRCAFRHWLAPVRAAINGGFRVVVLPKL